MTGGGTGGHIYPAIAIADKIKEKHPQAEILFVGTQRGLERTLVPQNGYPIRFITVSGFNRKRLLKNIKVFRDLRKGMREAKAILREFKPDVVIGTGGYVCGPIVRVADRMGIRTFIHEQNAYPGITNKLLEKHVEKVFLGFEDAKRHFKKQEKTVYTGNPVRRQFYEADKAELRKTLNIERDDFVLLSFGGSQGAAKINEIMMEIATTLSGIDHVQFYFITGKLHYDDILKAFQERRIELKENIHILPYLDKMDQALGACDLVISRSGALTVSEIIVSGKPSILIPSPNVTGNHQYYNAKVLSDKGGAILVEEKDLDAEKLIETLMKMINNRESISQMAKICSASAPESASEIIYQYLNLN